MKFEYVGNAYTGITPYGELDAVRAGIVGVKKAMEKTMTDTILPRGFAEAFLRERQAYEDYFELLREIAGEPPPQPQDETIVRLSWGSFYRKGLVRKGLVLSLQAIIPWMPGIPHTWLQAGIRQKENEGKRVLGIGTMPRLSDLAMTDVPDGTLNLPEAFARKILATRDQILQR